MRKIIVWHKHVKSWSVPMLLWTWKWNGVTSIAYYMHIYAHLPWHFDPTLSLTTPNRPHRKKRIYIYIKAKPWSSFLRTSRHHATVDGGVKRLQLKNGICYFLMRLAIWKKSWLGCWDDHEAKLHGFTRHFAIVCSPCHYTMKGNNLEVIWGNQNTLRVYQNYYKWTTDGNLQDSGYTRDGCRS